MTIPTVPQCGSITGIYGSPKLEAWMKDLSWMSTFPLRFELCILQVGMAAAGVKCVFHHAAVTQKGCRLAPESNCFGVELSCGANPCIASIFGELFACMLLKADILLKQSHL